MAHSTKRMLAIVQEWATELGKPEYKGHELIVADEAAKGFMDVERGRNPDVVLPEVLRRIRDRIDLKTGKLIDG